MSQHDQSARKPTTPGGFWTSRAGLTLVAFLAVAGLLLAYEHRVHLFTGSWALIVLLGLCVIMHAFMHGGHGSHGGDRRATGGDDER
jgi:peptidoglycan/LPS O-acetylase OafA/YrhL